MADIKLKTHDWILQTPLYLHTKCGRKISKTLTNFIAPDKCKQCFPETKSIPVEKE